MSDSLVLYGTEGCHLCDDAAALLRQAGLSWQDVDIVEQDTLLSAYGNRIPVLKRLDNGREIDWPFDSADVLRLLAN